MAEIDRERLLRHIARSDLTAVEKRYLEELVRADAAKDEWIKCSKSLPKVRTDVLLQFEDNMCVGFYSRGWWNVNSGNGIYTAVLPSEAQPIAWRPLPESLKEVDEDVD